MPLDSCGFVCSQSVFPLPAVCSMKGVCEVEVAQAQYTSGMVYKQQRGCGTPAGSVWQNGSKPTQQGRPGRWAVGDREYLIAFVRWGVAPQGTAASVEHKQCDATSFVGLNR
mmetsp:Transcript_2219/g.3535  ORF Transcript_2219/g.3535 Transcript_2219/m.3535 type:complete len:112 (-) Transcript_2219:168-503(-)